MPSDGLEFDRAVPGPSALLESLRGVGYTPWSAIADLVDNSITAGATRIRIDFVWRGVDSFIRIADDGRGMDEDTLVSAMRPGSRSPKEQRPPGDLGRFGLGLKTASFSQCRVLTVVSRTSGSATTARRWDLDHVARVDDWQLLVGVPPEVADACLMPDDLESGTIVLWTALDRLAGSSGEEDVQGRERFLEIARHVERHLAMTHHRFLEGPRPRLQLFFNGTEERVRVQAWDPFLQWHPATVSTPPERIAFAAGAVQVQGFVLPHRDRLTPEEFEAGGGPEGWLSHQGFFVYRAERLLVAGGWLGLGAGRRWARDDLHRLARIRVDLPNSTDADWRIDIRKSIASPPHELRSRLRGLAERVRADARDVLAHRGGAGPRAAAQPLVRAWVAKESAQGMTYKVERSHPAVRRALDSSPQAAPLIEEMLRIIELTVPVQRIWLDATERGEFRSPATKERIEPALAESLRSLFAHLVADLKLTPELARQRLLTIEPFSSFPSAVAALKTTES